MVGWGNTGKPWSFWAPEVRDSYAVTCAGVCQCIFRLQESPESTDVGIHSIDLIFAKELRSANVGLRMVRNRAKTVKN